MSLRESWRDFWRSTPGKRFSRRYQRLNQADRGLLARIARWVLGVILIVLGIIFMPLPGPGFVPVLAGAATLAGESMRVASFLDRAEIRVRSWLKR